MYELIELYSTYVAHGIVALIVTMLFVFLSGLALFSLLTVLIDLDIWWYRFRLNRRVNKGKSKEGE